MSFYKNKKKHFLYEKISTFIFVNVPNPCVCVVPKAEVAGFAKVVPNGAGLAAPKPVVCPNPVLVFGCPKSGFVWPKRLVVCVDVGVEKENPADGVAPKPVVDCVGFPKSELL